MSRRLVVSLASHALRRWEALFFLCLWGLLVLQDFGFVVDMQPLSGSLKGAISRFISFESIVVDRFSCAATLLIVLPLAYLVFAPRGLRWARSFLDVVELCVVARMFIRFIGLSLLVFDSVIPGFALINQFFMFLPCSLLVWG